jgi:hypothetical protein
VPAERQTVREYRAVALDLKYGSFWLRRLDRACAPDVIPGIGSLGALFAVRCHQCAKTRECFPTSAAGWSWTILRPVPAWLTEKAGLAFYEWLGCRRGPASGPEAGGIDEMQLCCCKWVWPSMQPEPLYRQKTRRSV